MSAPMVPKTQRPKLPAPPPPAPLPLTPKSRRLEIQARPGATEDDLLAELVTAGDATNAATAMRFVEAEHGEVSLTHMVAALKRSGDAVNAGDLSGAERMLNSQAVALNAIFAEMARRATLNIGDYLGATETYMRLGLKAQAQCRATVEALAAIKNPPVVYARQANIGNGPLQVNNGATVADAQVQRGHARTRAKPIFGRTNY